MRTFSTPFISIALAFLAGQTSAQGRTVVIDHNNPATSARLHLGDTLVIKLRVNAGLPYKWTLSTNNAPILTLLGSTSQPVRPNVLGGPIDQVFRFKGAAIGENTVAFTLLHQASGIKAIARHYRCRVRVTRKRKDD